MMDVLSYALSKKYTDEQIAEQKLKVAKVEKELNDYKSVMTQVNINQEAKQKASGYGIVSLPKNAAEGQISVVVKGGTYTNLLGDAGDFESANLGWSFPYLDGTGYSASSSEKSVVGTKSFKGVLTQTTATVRLEKNGVITQNHKYYVSAYIFPKYSQPTYFQLGGITGPVFHPTPNQWNRISSIIDCTNKTNELFRLFHRADSQYAVGDAIYFDGIMLVDLTAHGLENKTKEELDKMFAHYFNGTKSTLSARVKSVGKNLVRNGNGEEGIDGWLPGVNSFTSGFNTGTLSFDGTWFTITDQPSTGNGFYRKIRVKKNTNYTISFITQGGGSIYVYGEQTRTTIITAAMSTITFNSGENDYISVAIYSSAATNMCKFRQIQLEEGTQATEYEPYKETIAYLPNVVLRSLPNGVKDEIRIVEGKLIKRISDEYILNGSENWTGYTDSGDGFVYARIEGWLTGKNVLPDTANSALAVSSDGNYEILAHSLVQTAKRAIQFASSNATLWMKIEKSKVDAQPGSTGIEKFKNYLNQYPVTLIYQLAEPVEIPVQVSGTLLSYPSGTVYVENVVADAGLYSDGITVLHQDLPIKSIEKISKIDYETGLETILDASKAVIASDKLSFTHPDLKDGDIVFFIYEYDRESTIPEVEVEFYDSRYVVKDSATGKFYKWSITVTNGTPSIQLTEV